jgi:hypothetical protein
MNNTKTKKSVDAHFAVYNKIFESVENERAPPLIFRETNSLYNQGRPGLQTRSGLRYRASNSILTLPLLDFKEFTCIRAPTTA